MIKKSKFPSQYDQIVDLLRSTQAYLVGGAVRDALLGRPIHDLDFALPENTIKAAKKVADQLGGGFFVLDTERKTCRVILKDEDSQRLVVDFTLFEGNTIEEDLACRDFTITSMALDLGEDPKLIDLFRGARDLQEGLIRATSERSLADDPLRCLRAVRLAAQLGFQILPETKDQIRRYQHDLVDVSAERIRDELFRILAGPNQAAALLSLQMLGLYGYVLPGELSNGGSRLLKNLEMIWSIFIHDHDQERAASWKKGMLIHRLGRYRTEVRDFLKEELVPERSNYQLIFMIALLSDLSEGEAPWNTRQIIDQISLSNHEAAFLEKGISARLEWLSLSQEDRGHQAVDVFRFFNRFGSAGVAAIFLNLAEGLDDQSVKNDQDRWIKGLDKARFFLEGYWERYQEWVDPPAVLDGHDLQRELNIPPGPEIGSLLDLLREEQVRSGLKTKEDGLAFLKKQLPPSDGRDS